MLNDIIEVLASGLRIDQASVAWLARKLQDADLLPADGENDELSPLHAARLLVALLAAARPIDAAAAVAAYERASMLHVPVAEPAAAGLCCNFVAALARLIEAAATDPTTPLPVQVSARRSLGEPLGVLVDMPAHPEDPRRAVTVVYGRSSPAMGGASLEVYGTTSGSVLQALAGLLCPIDGARPARRRGNKPPPLSAQLRSPTSHAQSAGLATASLASQRYCGVAE